MVGVGGGGERLTYLRQNGLVVRQEQSVVGTDGVVLQSQVIRVSTRHEGGTGWGAGRLHVRLVQNHSLPSQSVQGRGGHERVPPPDIVPAQVIGEDEDDVRWSGRNNVAKDYAQQQQQQQHSRCCSLHG